MNQGAQTNGRNVTINQPESRGLTSAPLESPLVTAAKKPKQASYIRLFREASKREENARKTEQQTVLVEQDHGTYRSVVISHAVRWVAVRGFDAGDEWPKFNLRKRGNVAKIAKALSRRSDS
jgi:hypothetical protein